MSICILLNYLFNCLITLLYHYAYTRCPILIYKCNVISILVNYPLYKEKKQDLNAL